MSYKFIKKDQLDANDASNTHIFDVKKAYGIENVSTQSKCGKVRRLFTATGQIKDTGNEAREYAKDRENGGECVCGQCVATLYSDGK